MKSDRERERETERERKLESYSGGIERDGRERER